MSLETQEKIAVVVATLNRIGPLRQTIEAIRRSAGCLDLTLVVVDGGSTDGTREWLQTQGVALIKQEGPPTGAVAAYNLGFAWACDHEFQWFGILNDDDVLVGPEPELERAVNMLRADPAAGGVAFEFDLWGGWKTDSWGGATYINKGVLRRDAAMQAAVMQGDPTGRAFWNPLYHTYAADTEQGCWLSQLNWKVLVGYGLRVHDCCTQDETRARNHRALSDRGDRELFKTRSNNMLSVPCVITTSEVTDKWWDGLDASRGGRWSQSGEAGVLARIFQSIGEVHRTAVDVGAGDGWNLSNVRALLEDGWNGWLFDARVYAQGVAKECFDGTNAAALFARYSVPRSFDLLSLDIDGIDFWVLRDILRDYKPRVIVCEINGALPALPDVTVPLDKLLCCGWDNVSDYHGMSLGAVKALGKRHGYSLFYQNANLNAFLVRRELIPECFVPDMDLLGFRSRGYRSKTAHDVWHHLSIEDLR